MKAGIAKLWLVAMCGGAVALAEAPRTAWSKLYDGPASHSDQANAEAIDSLGYVHVTGSYYQPAVASHFVATLRYDPLGSLVWERLFEVSIAPEQPAAIAVDSADHIIVAGSGWGDEGLELFALKYDSAGTLLWDVHRPWSVSCGWAPTGPALAIGAEDAVYVGGMRDCQYYVVKLTAAGDIAWEADYAGLDGEMDLLSDLVVDEAGNVYVVGETGGGGGGYATVKFDAGGGFVWDEIELGPLGGSTLGPAHAALAPDGNLIVAGTPETTCGSFEFMTWKYTPGGTRLWLEHWPADPCGGAQLADVAVDGAGNVITAGTGFFDYAVVKRDADGNLLWDEFYNGPGDSTESMHAMALDAAGNVYVTGTSPDAQQNYDFATVKFDPGGAQLWAQRYAGPGAGPDQANGVAVDARGVVTVTGYAWASPNQDFATLKYAQHAAGDLNCDGAVNAFDIDAFVASVTDWAAYQLAQPNCDASGADVNGDGAVNAFDIDPFVELLTQ